MPKILVHNPNKEFQLSAFDDLQEKQPLSAIRVSEDQTALALLFGENEDATVGIIKDNRTSKISFPSVFDIAWKSADVLLLSLRKKEANEIVEYNLKDKVTTVIESGPPEKFLLLPAQRRADVPTKTDLPKNYKRQSITIPASDGHRIPYTEYYKDQNGPILLYVYGAYDQKMDTALSFYDSPFIEEGMTIAFADLRSAIGQNKAVTTSDLLSVIDYLSSQHRKIFLRTRSAGALPVVHLMQTRNSKIAGAILEAPLMYLTNLEKHSISWDKDEWGEKESAAAKKNTEYYAPTDSVLPPLFIWASKKDSVIPYEAVLEWIAESKTSKVIVVSDEYAPHEGPHMEDKLRELKAMEFEFVMGISEL